MQICSSFSKQKYSMIRYLSTLIFLIITACSNDGTNRNPYLQEISFRFEANLNLPSYSPLTNTGSAVDIYSSNRYLSIISLKSSYELSGVKEIALAPSFDGHHYSFIGFTAYSNDS